MSNDDQTPPQGGPQPDPSMPDPEKPLGKPEAVNLPAVRPLGTLQAKSRYAEYLSGSALLPAQYRGKASNLLFAIEYAEMLGLSPMAAITGIHVIDGKPTASAALISALVRRAGHKLRVKWDDAAKKATAQIVRKDDPEFTFEASFSLEDAKNAGLNGKDVWRKYPAAMCKARAITAVSRDACEEALMGAHYTPEELGATNVDEDGMVIDGSVVTGPTGLDPDALMEQIRAAVQKEDPVQAFDALRAIGTKHGREVLAATWPLKLPANGQTVNGDEALREALAYINSKVEAAAKAAGEPPTAQPKAEPQAEPLPDGVMHPDGSFTPDADGVVDAVLVEGPPAMLQDALQDHDAQQQQRAEAVAAEVGERLQQQGEQLNEEAEQRSREAAAKAVEEPNAKERSYRPWIDEVVLQAQILGVKPDEHGADLLATRGVDDVRDVPLMVLKAWVAAQRRAVIAHLRQEGAEAAVVAYTAVPAAQPASREKVFSPPTAPLG